MRNQAESRRKSNGQYFTDSSVASFLARWAVRGGSARVLEPSVGDGSFLEALHRRFVQLGSTGEVVAVEIDSMLLEQVRRRFPQFEYIRDDFFSLSAQNIGHFDAVVGNPPFIRYQRFNGQHRRRALDRAVSYGIPISGLSSSWAPFIAHAMMQLKPGGRLAMVVPFEITFAKYARPLVRRLAAEFTSVQVLAFDKPLFPDLSQRTALLLADSFGGSTATIDLVRFGSSAALKEKASPRTVDSVSVGDWVSGDGRVELADIPASVRTLYQNIAEHPKVRRLGEAVDLTIGYVTGDNEFFHLTIGEMKDWGLSYADVLPVLRRSADLNKLGLACLSVDFISEFMSSDHYLFCPSFALTAPASRYIAQGRAQGVHERYKCRNRDPWYRVPGVRVPDVFISVFASDGPRIVINKAGLAATNSLLIANLVDSNLHANGLAVSALTSLSLLSAEIEGHALGGGVLKLEPGEAKRLLLPAGVYVSESLISELDSLLRGGHFGEALDKADQSLLAEGLGLTMAQIRAVRRSVMQLRNNRRRDRREAELCSKRQFKGQNPDRLKTLTAPRNRNTHNGSLKA